MKYEKFDKISCISKITSYTEIDNDYVLVSYIPKLYYDLIYSHGLEFLKVVEKYKDKEIQNIDNTSITISAAITAYGRIRISRIKMYILS